MTNTYEALAARLRGAYAGEPAPRCRTTGETAAANSRFQSRCALPERCANVCFGGAMRNRLFMAASQSIYALYVNTQGAPGG